MDLQEAISAYNEKGNPPNPNFILASKLVQASILETSLGDALESALKDPNSELGIDRLRICESLMDIKKLRGVADIRTGETLKIDKAGRITFPFELSELTDVVILHAVLSILELPYIPLEVAKYFCGKGINVESFQALVLEPGMKMYQMLHDSTKHSGLSVRDLQLAYFDRSDNWNLTRPFGFIGIIHPTHGKATVMDYANQEMLDVPLQELEGWLNKRCQYAI